MKIKFLLLIILIPIICLSQKVKIKKVKYYNSDVIKLEYQVLRKNKYTKHGYYKKFTQTGILESKGYYDFGKRDGVWLMYHMDGSIKQRNFYQKGKLLSSQNKGVWRSEYAKGKVIKRYDYENNTSLKTLYNILMSYPPEAKEKQQQGIVKVKCLVNEKCEIVTLKVIQSACKSLDKEVLKHIKLLFSLHKKYDIKCEPLDSVFTFSFLLI